MSEPPAPAAAPQAGYGDRAIHCAPAALRDKPSAAPAYGQLRRFPARHAARCCPVDAAPGRRVCAP